MVTSTASNLNTHEHILLHLWSIKITTDRVLDTQHMPRNHIQHNTQLQAAGQTVYNNYNLGDTRAEQVSENYVNHRAV